MSRAIISLQYNFPMDAMTAQRVEWRPAGDSPAQTVALSRRFDKLELLAIRVQIKILYQ